MILSEKRETHIWMKKGENTEPKTGKWKILKQTEQEIHTFEGIETTLQTEKWSKQTDL